MTTYRRVEVTTRRIRYEFEAPVTAKTVATGAAWVQNDFEKLNGRPAQYDNDWWIEPTDDGVAFVFDVITTDETAPETDTG